MTKRKIIKIDEEKCNGCGLCIPNCHEGAIKIIDGKARLVSESACDGLGACLGHCPQGAITIEERDAEEYTEKKVPAAHEHKGCPGSKMFDFRKEDGSRKERSPAPGAKSELGQWPVQLKLVNPNATYFKGADILVAADCVPFAYANFHSDLLKGKILLVGCPKLDDIEYYKDKIAEILKNNEIRSMTYAHMEVPCCSGLTGVIKEAISDSGNPIPFKEDIISIRGERFK